MPAVLDRPHPLLSRAPEPSATRPVPGLISPATDLPGTEPVAAVDRRPTRECSCGYPLRSRSLPSSFHWIAAGADLRRTNLTRGEATLLSSHAGDPRAVAGDTTIRSDQWSTADSESARRQPETQPGRSDATARHPHTYTHDNPTALRASSRSRKMRMRLILPSMKS